LEPKGARGERKKKETVAKKLKLMEGGDLKEKCKSSGAKQNKFPKVKKRDERKNRWEGKNSISKRNQKR